MRMKQFRAQEALVAMRETMPCRFMSSCVSMGMASGSEGARACSRILAVVFGGVREGSSELQPQC